MNAETRERLVQETRAKVDELYIPLLPDTELDDGEWAKLHSILRDQFAAVERECRWRPCPMGCMIGRDADFHNSCPCCGGTGRVSLEWIGAETVIRWIEQRVSRQSRMVDLHSVAEMRAMVEKEFPNREMVDEG